MSLPAVVLALACAHTPPAPEHAPSSGPSHIALAAVGGCDMLPPGCVAWRIAADGRFTRSHNEDGRTVGGTLDDAATRRLFSAFDIDVRAALTDAPRAPCTAPMDGVDAVLRIARRDGTRPVELHCGPQSPSFLASSAPAFEVLRATAAVLDVAPITKHRRRKPTSITVARTGGCARSRTCTTLEVRPDGSVERAVAGGDPVPVRIDAYQANGVFDTAADTDLQGLLATLGPGECHGCVDGIDTQITLAFAKGPPVVFDGQTHHLEATVPLFAQVESLTRQVEDRVRRPR